MRDGTITREELAEEFGEAFVEGCEDMDVPGYLDLHDRAFIRYGGDCFDTTLAPAYLRGRAAGTCPCYGLPDFWWNHWDVDGLCNLFPCPACHDASMFFPYDPDDPEDVARHSEARREDEAREDDAIPF